MSFTRFHDDPIRIQKQLEESSFAGRYMLTTPGQGLDLPFMEDAQLRLQHWGANKRNNSVNLESDLFGLTRKLNRDLVDINDYKKHESYTEAVNYRASQPFVQESRASHPAWMYKDLEQTRWETPFINPQNNIERPFYNNIQTRILEKDNFIPKIPIIEETYYFNENVHGNVMK
jgi:hypothetical protein